MQLTYGQPPQSFATQGKPGRASGRRQGQIQTLQALRAFAAVLVVFQHFADHRGIPLPADLGTHGVALFFVLSGFVLPLSVRSGSAVQFLLRRLERILPMYWLFTTVKLFMSSTAWASLRPRPPAYIIGSYLLIPTLAPDGTLLPLLPVGWTLSFEMAFYAMVAVAIVLQRRPFAGLLLTLALLASSRPFLSHVELLVFFRAGRPPGL